MELELNEIQEQVNRCIRCETCMDVCPSYSVKKEYAYSPLGRIDALEALLKNQVTENEEKSLLTCNICGRCTQVCPQNIQIGELVILGRNLLYTKEVIPTSRHKKIIESIINKENAVTRERNERVTYRDPAYKKYVESKSDTLLFLGCISSFFQENTAKAAVQVLNKLGIEFRLLQDEGCCGIFLYDGGYFDKAESVFKKNVERFESIGIKRIVVLCPSCYKCFGIYYPKLLGKFDIQVFHFVELIAQKVEDIKIRRLTADLGMDLILHEPCKMSRVMHITEEPRKILNSLGIRFKEFEENKEMSFCCGAGGGVRAYDMNLALGIGASVLKKANDNNIVTMCPFCTMNFNHSAKKNGLKTKAFHIAEILLSSLEVFD